MNDTLKPCPFCGSPALNYEDDGVWFVVCSIDCDATPAVLNKDSNEAALAIWNRRVEPAPATVREWTKLDITALNEYLSGPEGQAISDFIRERTAYLEAAKKVSVGSYGAAPPAAADARDALAVKLAPYYRKDYLLIAELCDEVLDRSGGLLGKVRDAAMSARAER